jgi:hypothetical protein
MTRLVRIGVLSVVVLASCRDAASRVFPDTPLGRTGRDWLAAHNRGEGHAVVHFTLVNRGSALITGAQTDSIVSSGVRLAQAIGPLVPVRLMYSTDTALAVLLQSADTASRTWTARFRPVVQPNFVKVQVEIRKR